MDLKEFLDMGGYAKYVWPAYGICAAVLLLNWVLAKRALRREIAAVQRRTTAGAQS